MERRLARRALVACSTRTEIPMYDFVLDAVNTLLANEDDPRSIKVFDSSIQGQTDRFAFRFVKP
jgi:predicted methyltransferase